MKLFAICYGLEGRNHLIESSDSKSAIVEASKIFDLGELEYIEVYEITLNGVPGSPNWIKQ
jgi:hypothetical protein